MVKIGCNCGKSKAAQVPGVSAAARRVTVYQAMGPEGSVIEEFNSLPEARAKAVEVSGRVKIASKMV